MTMASDAAARRRSSRRERAEHETEFARIVAFSDGVLAIAITLLVLNLDVPTVSSNDRDALFEALGDLGPHLFAYGLSFAVIGRFWLIHHRFFATLSGFDGTLLTANLLYLALIVLVPFSSDVLGTYGENEAALVVYAAILGAAALVNWLMIRHALRRDLVRAEERRSTEPFGSPGALAIPGVFLLSIPVAFLSTLAAQLLWVALLVFRGQRRVRGG
jgi:uncharacterized membrane protein